MDRVTVWFLSARHKFIWDLETIRPYVDVLVEVVYHKIRDLGYSIDAIDSLTVEEIGIFPIGDEENGDEIIGYALYVADVRLPPDRRNTLYARFRDSYQIAVGAGFAEEFFFNEDLLKAIAPPGRGEELIRRKRELVRNFESLANRSWNRRRHVSARLRYQVLMRDDSTCQICGRRAPEVPLHIDHIKPISLDLAWEPSDDPDDYRVLCRDCNIGRGNLSWLLTE